MPLPISRTRIPGATSRFCNSEAITAGDKPVVSKKTRAERKAETKAAVKAGETPKAGEDISAGDKPVASTKSKAERKAETKAAVKAGDTTKPGQGQ